MQTLSQIFANYSDEIQQVRAGGEISNELYEVLFGYFCESGEMPYGAATASTEDPYEWIENYIRSTKVDIVTDLPSSVYGLKDDPFQGFVLRHTGV